MVNTSTLYKTLLDSGGIFETHIQIELNENSHIDFYDDSIFAANTVRDVFGSQNASVGNCVSSRISFQTLYPVERIPEMAKVRLFVRVRLEDEVSEEIPQGVFYIDTRKKENITGVPRLSVTGYDSMMLAEKDMDYDAISFPATVLDIVTKVSEIMQVPIDMQTQQKLADANYTIDKPTKDYTYREMLGIVATMFLGNFVVTKENTLKMLQAFGKPPVLIDSDGAILTIGGDSIIV